MNDLSIQEEQLLGTVAEIQAANAGTPVAQVAASLRNKVARNGRGSRGDALARIDMFPEDIQRALASRAYQLSDRVLYANRAIGGQKSAKIFQEDDDKVVGLRNISKAQLGANETFLLHAIAVTYGVGGAGDDTPGDVAFGAIPAVVRNGEFELIHGSTTVIARCSNELFHSAGNSRVKEGLYILDNPKVLRAQTTLQLNMEWADAAAANSWLKVQFYGSMPQKA